MTWFDRLPEDLVEQSEPSEALAAVRQLEQLTPTQLQVLDVYLNHWVLVVLLRPDDREGVLELLQLCRLAREFARVDPQVAEYAARLDAFADLLEGRRRVAQANKSKRPFKLLHENAILDHAATGPCKQSELADLLDLSAGRVSQVLGILETRGKIVRSRTGKESWIALPASSNNVSRAHDAGGQGYLVNQMFSKAA